MIRLPQQDREALDAIWDDDDAGRADGAALGYVVVASAAAIVGMAIWSLASK